MYCDATGKINCTNCKGARRLRFFIQLAVEFKNNQETFSIKNAKIPDDLINDCKSYNIYSEQNKRVISKYFNYSQNLTIIFGFKH